MITITIDEACQIMDGTVNNPVAPKRRFRGVSVDTRTLKSGNAFFCLSGERTDGHRHVPQAVRQGAGVIVAERRRARKLTGIGVSVIGVDDPLFALGQLASEYLSHFPTRYVAVTGSVGKTTTKELIAAALAARYDVFKSPGNFNTLIGIPLALLSRSLRTGQKQKYGVLEFGMSTPGEIARLTDIVNPSWGVMTRIGAAHLLHMKSVASVARAKKELFDHADSGMRAVLNSDDPYQRRWMARWSRPTTTYALEQDADFTASDIESTSLGVSFRANNRHQCRLRLAGEYNVPNALAALAVGRSLRIPFSDMIPRLGTVRPVGERSRVSRIAGVTLIEDCYNANPTSTTAALHSLAGYPGAGRKIAVLGGMHELGRQSRTWHEQVGRSAADLDLVITIGSLAQTYRTGIPKSVESIHCARPAQAVSKLTRVLKAGDVVLVKGSRAEGLETVTQSLRAKLASARAGRI